MLEGLIAWVLNNYVGDYLQVNNEQLSVALLQGQVELENVPIKRTALRKFDIPLEVKAGVIGRLSLSISPLYFRSEPWLLRISDLLVVLGPPPHNAPNYDVEYVERYEQAKKEAMLDELEHLHKAQLKSRVVEAGGTKPTEQGMVSTPSQFASATGAPQPTGTELSQESQRQWWGASLVSSITHNIQVVLDNVHIRYERGDEEEMDGNATSSSSSNGPYASSCFGAGKRGYAFGLRIQNMSISTTNAQWRACFVQPTDEVNTFKRMEVKGLSLYWNTGTSTSHVSHRHLPDMTLSIDDLKRLLMPQTHPADSLTEYLLKPLSLEVRMEKNGSKRPLLKSTNGQLLPRFKFHLSPERIEVELTRAQIRQIRQLNREWALYDRGRRHRKWRPRCSIAEDPRRWWRFVIERIVEEERETKPHKYFPRDVVLARLQYLVSYSREYEHHLVHTCLHHQPRQALDANTWAKLLVASNRLSAAAAATTNVALMKQIERDAQLPYAHLHLIREAVLRRVLVEMERLKIEGSKEEEPIFEDRTQQDQQQQDEGIEVFELVSPNDDSPFPKLHRVGETPTKSRKTNFTTAALNDPSAGSLLPPTTAATEAEGVDGENRGGGWYGWITGWWGSQNSETKEQIIDDMNEAFPLHPYWHSSSADYSNYNDHQGPFGHSSQQLSSHLSPESRRMEEELMDVLSDSYNDSTLLRKDALLAELLFKLEHAVIRIVDGGPNNNGGGGSELPSGLYSDTIPHGGGAGLLDIGSGGASRILALEMRSVRSRLQFSPRENRTEVSLTLGDCTLQRVEVRPLSCSPSPPPPTSSRMGAYSPTGVGVSSTSHRMKTPPRSGGGMRVPTRTPTTAEPEISSSFQSACSGDNNEGEEEEENDERFYTTAAESLLYGFGGKDEGDGGGLGGAFGQLGVDTRLLLAVGKWCRGVEGGEDVGDKVFSKKSQSPMMELHYKRVAPRLEVLHELLIRLSPLSVMYDEGALDGLSNLFTASDPSSPSTLLIHPNGEGLLSDTIPSEPLPSRHPPPSPPPPYGSTTSSRLYLLLEVPLVMGELRRRKRTLLLFDGAQLNEAPLDSRAFAAARLERMHLRLVRESHLLTRWELEFDALRVEDLFSENSGGEEALSHGQINDDDDDHEDDADSGGATEENEAVMERVVKNPYLLRVGNRMRNVDGGSEAKQFWEGKLSRSLSCPSIGSVDNIQLYPHLHHPLPSLNNNTGFSPLAKRPPPPDMMIEDSGLGSSGQRRQKFSAAGEVNEEVVAMAARGGQSVKGSRSMLRFTIVDAAHPKFHEEHKARSCSVSLTTDQLDIGMNRRAWLMLLDFFGLLGSRAVSRNSSGREDEERVVDHGDGDDIDQYTLYVDVRTRMTTLQMCYPANDTKLAECAVENCEFSFETNITNDALPIVFLLSGTEFRLNDCTPFYSQLYPERVVVGPANAESSSSLPTTHSASVKPPPYFRLELLKYRRPDPQGVQRPFDVQLGVEHDPGLRIHFIHTQRFFASLLDYWWNFAELMDQVYRQNSGMLSALATAPSLLSSNAGGAVPAVLKTRCAVDLHVDAECELLLPLNQFSEELLAVKMRGGMRVTNRFMRASQLGEHFPEFGAMAATAGDGGGGGTSGGSVSSDSQLPPTQDYLIDETVVECRGVELLPALQVASTSATSSLGLLHHHVVVDQQHSSTTGAALPSNILLSSTGGGSKGADDWITSSPVLGKIFKNYAFHYPSTASVPHSGQLVNRPFNIDVTMLRNLSSVPPTPGGGGNGPQTVGSTLPMIPELTVKAELSELQATLTDDNWRLVRGVLDWNFGEPISLKPATIPRELLHQQPIFQVPNDRTTTLDKHPLLAVRMTFNSIGVNFLAEKQQQQQPPPKSGWASGGKGMGAATTTLSTGTAATSPGLVGNRSSGAGGMKEWDHFARADFTRAHISYECSLAQAELNVLCEAAEFLDTTTPSSSSTFTSPTNTKKQPHHPFPSIISSSLAVPSPQNQPPRASSGGLAENQSKPAKSPSMAPTSPPPPQQQPPQSMLFEAHTTIRVGEVPTTTLVLQDARVLAQLDWLEKLRGFLLATSDFVPPNEFHAAHDPSHFLFNVYSVPKRGVLVRTPAMLAERLRTARAKIIPQPAHTFTLRVTLKECDLVLAEDRRAADSLALIAHTTAVVAARDSELALVECQLEIQSLNLAWCLLGSVAETRRQLTNDFSATVALTNEAPPTRVAGGSGNAGGSIYTNRRNNTDISGGTGIGGGISGMTATTAGFHHLDELLPRQRLSIELVEELIARLSYRDYHALTTTLANVYYSLWGEEAQPTSTKGGANDPLGLLSPDFEAGLRILGAGHPTGCGASMPQHSMFSVSKLHIKAERASLWLLDESAIADGRVLPLARALVTKLWVDSGRLSDELRAEATLAVDYFNQRVFGWEPLLEPWHVAHLGVKWKGQRGHAPRGCSLTLRADPATPFDVNLTPTLLRQLRQFATRFAATRRALADVDGKYGDEEVSTLHSGEIIGSGGGGKTLSASWRRSLLNQSLLHRHHDHLPYVLRNECGSPLVFTTLVDELAQSRKEGRRCNAKWYKVGTGRTCTFEYPARLLSMARSSGGIGGAVPGGDEGGDSGRMLVLRVDEWEEICPAINADAVGTYFRVVRMAPQAQMMQVAIQQQQQKSHNQQQPQQQLAASMQQHYARIVVMVSIDRDGRKVVTVQSALTIVNRLSDAVLLKFDNSRVTQPHDRLEMMVEAGERRCAPLRYVNGAMEVKPASELQAIGMQVVDWRQAEGGGGSAKKKAMPVVANRCLRFPLAGADNLYYWVCVAIKRERFPEREWLTGHTIYLVPPITLLNMLPCDVELTVSGRSYPATANQQVKAFNVNLEEEFRLSLSSDRFHSVAPLIIQRSAIAKDKAGGGKQFLFPLVDRKKRLLHAYCTVGVGRGDSLHASVWVPVWVVNHSGLPLVLKQEATEGDAAAGQFEEHERAKDRNPLMFSFVEEDCPQRCRVRLGGQFLPVERGYTPEYSRSFELTSGVQALRVALTHMFDPDIVYNIGVEVRQGTGRYKNTQVVLLTPRYRVNNQSSHRVYLSRREDIHDHRQHLTVESRSSMIWHDDAREERMLCIRAAHIEHWSCPIRIDQIASFLVVMRDRDETPRFLRAEISLKNASFWVTLTDADHFPAPIRLENASTVPVLYQQNLLDDRNRGHHLRAICPAGHIVDYSWDNVYAAHQLILQVYENKSNIYDPRRVGAATPLYYENHLYIRLASTFPENSSSSANSSSASSRKTSTSTTTCDQQQPALNHQCLVLAARREGKVVLARLNPTDSSRSQLWRWGDDGCLENVGMSLRVETTSADERYVLDVLEGQGGQPHLMMLKRDVSRNRTQRWVYTADGRVKSAAREEFIAAADGGTALTLLSPAAGDEEEDRKGEDLRKSEESQRMQRFQLKRQKPGTGTLDVQCIHKGPTQILRITDREDPIVKRIVPSSIKLLSSSSALPQHLLAPMSKSHSFDHSLTSTRYRGTGGTQQHAQHPSAVSSSSAAQPTTIPMAHISIELPSGIGVSLVGRSQEELVYLRLGGVKLVCEQHTSTDPTNNASTYRLHANVDVVQADNQLLQAERWQLLHSEVRDTLARITAAESQTLGRLGGGGGGLGGKLPGVFTRPALSLEVSCTPTRHYYEFDTFRMKMADTSLLLDEALIWKLVEFYHQATHSGPASTQPTASTSTASASTSDPTFGSSGGGESNSAEAPPPQPPDINPDSPEAYPAAAYPIRRCYFGLLELEVGEVALTVMTVGKNGLVKELRKLKEQYNVKLVSFENAVISLPSFRQMYYVESMQFLMETLSKFYASELKKQTFNIFVTMDAFGNPLGLATDIKDSFQGLLFEGDVGGFVFGLTGGLTNTISKVASSMAQGVGSLTFDEQHEQMRRRILRSQSHHQSGETSGKALSHFYGGVKGLGVGVFGGLTAIAKNTLTYTQKDGVTGLIRGVTTGAVDTVTKPLQGALDLLEGTASAVKELAVGGPVVCRSFAEHRIRLPRTCMNLHSLLPHYSAELAAAQQELLRINSNFSAANNELLLDVVKFFTQQQPHEGGGKKKGGGGGGERVSSWALICSEQCYVLRTTQSNSNAIGNSGGEQHGGGGAHAASSSSQSSSPSSSSSSSQVVQRIPYKYLKNIQPVSPTRAGHCPIQVTYDQSSLTARRLSQPTLVCSSLEIADLLCAKVLRAKQLYDHSRRTLASDTRSRWVDGGGDGGGTGDAFDTDLDEE